jgi:hypothetical protein
MNYKCDITAYILEFILEWFEKSLPQIPRAFWHLETEVCDRLALNIPRIFEIQSLGPRMYLGTCFAYNRQTLKEREKKILKNAAA